MNIKSTEILVGLFMAIGLASLFMLAMKVSNLNIYNNDEGYEITANFDDISGLKVKSPVTMSGVRIGRVSDITFDSQLFEAVVKIRIESQYKTLPKDTSASVFILPVCWVKNILVLKRAAMKKIYSKVIS